MINWQTILSSFDDKGTLLKWLKAVENALENASLADISITTIDETNVKIRLTYADGTYTESDTLTLARGETGNGIESITKTGTSGLVDTYKITFTDGDTQTYTVTNGEDGTDGVDGRSIVSLVHTATVGLLDYYKITFSDESGFTYTVRNGADGADGTDGVDGTDGTDGRGIVSILKTGTSGLVDVYTITYTDQTTSQFSVTNGVGSMTPSDLLGIIEGSDYISVDLNQAETKVAVELDETMLDTVVTEDSVNLITSGAVFDAVNGLTADDIIADNTLSVQDNIDNINTALAGKLAASKTGVASVGGLVTPSSQASNVQIVGTSSGAQVGFEIGDGLTIEGSTSPYTLKASGGGLSSHIYMHTITYNGVPYNQSGSWYVEIRRFSKSATPYSTVQDIKDDSGAIVRFTGTIRKTSPETLYAHLISIFYTGSTPDVNGLRVCGVNGSSTIDIMIPYTASVTDTVKQVI